MFWVDPECIQSGRESGALDRRNYRRCTAQIHCLLYATGEAAAGTEGSAPESEAAIVEAAETSEVTETAEAPEAVEAAEEAEAAAKSAAEAAPASTDSQGEQAEKAKS